MIAAPPFMKVGFAVLPLAVVFFVTAWASSVPISWNTENYLAIHTLSEIFAAVVAFLTFAVGWNSPERERPLSIVFLTTMFFFVGVLDIVHALSLPGMPALVSENTREKAIFFWLSGRLIEAVALLMIAVSEKRRARTRKPHYLIFAGGLIYCSFAIWVGVFHLNLFPHTFVRPQGLTPFKNGMEYFIVGIHLVAQTLLLLRISRLGGVSQESEIIDFRRLFVANTSMAFCELFMTLYRDIPDLPHFVGHLYKVIAYTLIYRAVFIEMVHEPFVRLKKSEEQLRQSQKMEAVGLLASGVAHDFNNVLIAITGFVDGLWDRFASLKDARDELEGIRKAAAQAKGLTRQLLAFSRAQILQPKVLDLNDTVQEMVGLLAPLIGRKIQIKTYLAPDLKYIKADESQMRQVIMNLALNARDAIEIAPAPNGDRLITIETANLTATRVALIFSDTGCGMDEKTRTRIFDPFFTTKENRGSGLGLATVYGIVRQSGGEIHVSSRPGKGSTFEIYLPSTQEHVSASKRREVSTPSQSRMTILLAEDQDAVRSLLQEGLEAQGFSVLAARDGQEALEIADRHSEPIHLLVTDFLMPKLGGADLAKQLSEKRPEMRILYMSGYLDDLAELPGSDDRRVFMEKPFRINVLVDRVKDILGTSIH